jgi:hypothetical protein
VRNLRLQTRVPAGPERRNLGMALDSASYVLQGRACVDLVKGLPGYGDLRIIDQTERLTVFYRRELLEQQGWLGHASSPELHHQDVNLVSAARHQAFARKRPRIRGVSRLRRRLLATFDSGFLALSFKPSQLTSAPRLDDDERNQQLAWFDVGDTPCRVRQDEPCEGQRFNRNLHGSHVNAFVCLTDSG